MQRSRSYLFKRQIFVQTTHSLTPKHRAHLRYPAPQSLAPQQSLRLTRFEILFPCKSFQPKSVNEQGRQSHKHDENDAEHQDDTAVFAREVASFRESFEGLDIGSLCHDQSGHFGGRQTRT